MKEIIAPIILYGILCKVLKNLTYVDLRLIGYMYVLIYKYLSVASLCAS